MGDIETKNPEFGSWKIERSNKMCRRIMAHSGRDAQRTVGVRLTTQCDENHLIN